MQCRLLSHRLRTGVKQITKPRMQSCSGAILAPQSQQGIDIEGAYEVLGIFDRVEEKRDAMESLTLPVPARQAIANAALRYRFGEEHQPVTISQLLTPRRYEDYSDDLWTVYQRIQENLIKGGLAGRNAKGRRNHTRPVKGIDGDVKLNRALWVMAENMLEFFERAKTA